MTPATFERAPVILYVRVSARNDRADETFHSPREQAERARAHAEAQGYTPGPVIEDIDVSGATHPEDRPGMREALEMVRSGAAGGIVAGWLDRLTRDPSHGDWLVSEVTSHGGILAAPDMPADIDSPVGEFTFGMLLGVARLYRRQAGARIAGAKERSILAGVPIGPVPVGYRLAGHPTKPRKEWGDAERQIVVDPETAPAVRDIFARRAKGEGWGALAGVLEAATGRAWSRQALSAIVANRFYRGELVYGEIVGPAHEALVDEPTFQVANGRRGDPRPARSANGAWLLTGTARCSACGNRLVPWTGAASQGANRRYICATRACERRRKGIAAKLLENYVLRMAFALLGSKWQSAAVDVDTEALEAALEIAERRYAAMTTPEMIDALGPDYAAQIKTLRLARDEAARALGAARAKAGPAGPVIDVRESWEGMSATERRDVLARYAIARVEVAGPREADVLIEWR